MTPQSIEGDNFDTAWSRAVTWTNVCNDGLITVTAQSSDYSYTLWTEPGDGLDLSSFFATTTHAWCVNNMVWSDWTFGSNLNTLIKDDYATTKKIVFNKFDDSSKVATYTNTVKVTLDSTDQKTFTFTVVVVDGCTSITSTTIPSVTQ